MSWRRLPAILGQIVWVLAALCGTATVGVAQERLVTATLESSAPTSRTQGPIVLVWRLNSQFTGVLRGNLVAAVIDGGEVLSQVTSDELALTAGSQSVRMILPAVDSRHGGGGTLSDLKVSLYFAGQEFRGGLGEFQLRVPDQWERGFAIAVSDPWEAAIPAGVQALSQALRFEAYCKTTEEKTWNSSASHFRPRNLPAEPLGYCGFNVLLLMREGLGELREEQLDAITDWVHAGGAVCLAPETMVLERRHIAFLDRLAGSGVGREPLVLDGAGRVSQEGATEPRFCRYGLGRSVYLPPSGDNPLANPDTVRRTVGFLWNLQGARLMPLVETGLWDRPPDETGNLTSVVSFERQQYRQVRPKDRQLAPEPLQSADQLLGILIPRTMRLLPLWLVGMILAGYVLLIGPVDYLGLGLLKQRKWTWVLFPLVTFGITLLTVRLSHWYMGNTETQKRVLIADVGREARVARTNEFRLRVSGTERQFETEVVGGLFTTVDHRRYGAGGWYSQWVNTLQNRNDDENTRSGAPQIAGRIPGQFVVRQYLPQWSPRLNRIFRIDRHQARESIPAGDAAGVPLAAAPAADIVPLEFDWTQFEDATRFNPHTLAEEPARAVLAAAVDAVPDLKQAMVFTGKSLINIGNRQTAVFRTIDGASTTRYYPTSPESSANNAFLRNICVHEQGALFDVISRLAPHGGGDFEDLPLLDASSPDEWLLVLCVERGDDTVVWRKLYTGGK